MRAATWEINPQHTRESLRTDNNTMSETEFNMEFGAEFSGTGLESFFTEEQIKPCFTGHNLRNRDMGQAGNTYFIHLDPATSSHNYALAVVHKEFYLDHETQKANFRVIVDHIKYWQPVDGAINPNVVMEYVLSLRRRFHLGLITYDAFTSQESILKMRKAGIPNKETKFLPIYKFTIYKELENLINSGRLLIPFHHLLYNEMLELQRKFTPTGFKVLPKQEGDGVKSDDIVDCIAGACYMAVERQVSKLPQSKIANLGNPSGNQVAWRNMQGGVYGVGSGGQVARALENRSALWRDLHNQGRLRLIFFSATPC